MVRYKPSEWKVANSFGFNQVVEFKHARGNLGFEARNEKRRCGTIVTYSLRGIRKKNQYLPWEKECDCNSTQQPKHKRINRSLSWR